MVITAVIIFCGGLAVGLQFGRSTTATKSTSVGQTAQTGQAGQFGPVGVVTDGWLTLASDPADFIGQGEHLTFTMTTAAFDIAGTAGGARASVNASPEERFDMHFVPPQGRNLSPGLYPNAQRWPFQSPVAPGMDIDGVGRGCNELSGTYQVVDMSFDPAGRVTELDIRFEQHCEHALAALRGELWATTLSGHHKHLPSIPTA
ncbi:MAG TPA: hypothetical protein VF160_11235 [Candidatus Dormibacteraeota bacterium]